MDEQASGLRMVALASVAALAVVLPLAAATGPHDHAAPTNHSGQRAVERPPHARTTSAKGYGPLNALPRSGGAS